MLAAFLRIAIVIAVLVGAVILFAFAFTTAAIIVLVLLVIGAILGRRPGANVWVFRQGPSADDSQQRAPLTIDHDPNDLPPDRK